MPQSPRSRRSTNLIHGLEHPLSAYALCAGAAGVGILALPQAAEAEVVYTPAHIRVNPGSFVGLDLNNDGTVDFNFTDRFTSTTTSGYRFGLLYINPTSANEVGGNTGSASNLGSGVRIGPNGAFNPGVKNMASGSRLGFGASTACHGRWDHAQKRYLALKFTSARETHFGWARLDVSCSLTEGGQITGLVTGYAYETIPNKAIVSGTTSSAADEPQEGDSTPGGPVTVPDVKSVQAPTLGALALGAEGTGVWRRQNEAEPAK